MPGRDAAEGTYPICVVAWEREAPADDLLELRSALLLPDLLERRRQHATEDEVLQAGQGLDSSPPGPKILDPTLQGHLLPVAQPLSVETPGAEACEERVQDQSPTEVVVGSPNRPRRLQAGAKLENEDRGVEGALRAREQPAGAGVHEGCVGMVADLKLEKDLDAHKQPACLLVSPEMR